MTSKHQEKINLWISILDDDDPIADPDLDFANAKIVKRDGYPINSIKVGRIERLAHILYHPRQTIINRRDLPRKERDRCAVTVWEPPGAFLARALLEYPRKRFLLYLTRPDGARLCGAFFVQGIHPMHVKNDPFWGIVFKDAENPPAHLAQAQPNPPNSETSR